MKKKTTETTNAAVIDAPLQLAALPTLEHERVWHIPVRDITPSPFQPRKEFPAEEMEVLKQSVAANGIRIPLLGRRLNPDNDAVELIAGERRWRTAQALNLETVPMIVQPLTDDEVIRIQRLENAGRENLKALEAAEDYVLLQNQGRTVEEIMALHGVGRSHVFTRMRVAKLPENIKQLIKDGKLSITIADLIAKLPTEEMQQEVTERAIKPDYYGDTMSFRAVQELITEEYTRNLSGAAWLKSKSGDVDLIDGVSPCATCPKRSGNMEASEGSANVCTDVKCFAAKEAAHSQRMLAAATAKGLAVIDPETYQRNSYKYEGVEDDCYDDPKERTWGELAKAANIEPSVTVSAGQVVEVFSQEQQSAIRAALKIKREKSSTGASAADKAKQQAEIKAIEDAITEATLAASRDIYDDQPVPLALWRQLARTLVAVFEFDLKHVFPGRGLKSGGSHEKDWATIQDYINRQQSCHNLVGLVVELALRRKVSRYSPELLTVWDVDWKQFLPGAKTKSPAKAAKAAKEEKPKKAKTAAVKRGRLAKVGKGAGARRSQTAATKKGGAK